MGKKNKNKTAQAAQQQQQQTNQQEVSQKQEATKTEPQKENKKEETEQQQQQQQEPELTIEEKTQQFRETQTQFYQGCLAKLAQEEKDYKPYDTAVIEKELQAKETSELQKIEKECKRDSNKFDEIYQNTGNSAQAVNKLHEKVLATIKKIRKVNNEYVKVDQELKTINGDITAQQGIVQSNDKKRKMMETLSNSIIEKMITLYQKHEEDLASERSKRQELAESFQSKMNTINDQLNSDKDRRTKEVQTNDEIRKKITKAIDEYKLKEKSYNECMDANQAVIKDIEKKMQTRIQGDLQVTIKSCEGKKAKYEKVVDEVKHLSERIDDKLKEFGSLKDEMENLTKKFEYLKVDLQNKHFQLQLLDTQNTNIQLGKQKVEKNDLLIKEEKLRLMQQVETLRGITKALQMQKKSMEEVK